MRILVLAIVLMALHPFSSDLYAQNLQADCECDFVIDNENQNIPSSQGNSGKGTEDKTVCFTGNFEYNLVNEVLGKNVSLCVGEGVKLNIDRIDFKGDKTIHNFGILNLLDNSLTTKNNRPLVFSKQGEIAFTGIERQVIDFMNRTEIGSLSINNQNDVELIQGNLDVFRNIELLNGNLITNHSGTTPEENLITFKSDSVNTAILREVAGSNRIIGAIRVERYLSKSNRAFRYLSSSLNSAASIQDNWQEGVNNTVNNYNSNKNPNPGYGTHITGNLQGNNGFDASLTGNPSLFSWNSSSGNWEAIANTDQTLLKAGKAYSLLVRGDRSTNIYTSNSAYEGSTTLRSLGELVVGNVDLSDQLNKTPAGFSLVGNPYQAQVDIKKTLQKSSSHLKRNFYYAWSPALQTRGGYVTVDLDTNPVEYIPAGKDFTSTTQKNFRFIQPNQSVFIETANSASEQTPPTLIFKEEFKTKNTVSNQVFSIPEQIGKIDLTLARKQDNQVVDGVRFKFSENYANEVNQYDATKVWNNEEAFSIVSNNANYLAIEKRQYPDVGEQLKFWIGNYTTQEYTMLIELSDIEGYEVFLKDNYLDRMIILENGGNNIDFTVDKSIAESSSSDRFELRFEPVTLSTQNSVESEVFELYPNPSSRGLVYLRHDPMTSEESAVEVFSMLGQKMKVASERVSNSEVKLNVSSLSTGLYLVKLSNSTQSRTKKLIIK
ncbi:T9SS type A sorting domain-containing protein [Psychroflexus sediminis]|uniref:Por secretion system C-terminal sorting domain-containing protein n=1 Tax=Psychroflexus sediminis TaxID=470826 RepID=A0A1G7VC26_9FLAO|nr:T9SS type A sorting domain-containing protein [Psychroflexus sediminis]SDG57395.1 Por secretion system C-terminal sorting domain-containing protein [Psychroflexus sediminis]